MTEQIILAGILDLDDANSNFPKGAHRDARNVVFRGTENNYRAENVKGTRQIAFTLPSGNNQCIGSFYDEQKQRVFWFNWNSNGRNGIYQLDTISETITPLLICFTQSANDILNFSPNRPIHSVNIIYGDASLGDILTFVDSLKRPSKINIDRAVNNNYGTIERSFLDIAKEQPLTPPVAVMADDNTATVNNIRKALFQFTYRYVYDDNDKSVWSALSSVPLPVNFLNTNNDADPTKNSKITLTLKTGKSNVKKIELAARQSGGAIWADPYLVTTFNKADLSIGNNTTYTYDFKNNVSGGPIDLKEFLLLFDYVPREANTQELLNGNIIIYGGIKEGYDNGITINATLTTDLIAGPTNANDITAAYNWNTKQKLGLVYYDEKGRTPGVVTNPSFDISTLAYTESSPTAVNIPRVLASIAHRPPTWAVSYQWVRTKNLSQQKYLYWETQSTFKDTEFAYLSLANLFQYLKDNPASAEVLTYDFTPGDRVKFIKRISGGSTATVYTGKDYEVVGLVVNPTITATTREGQYLKIKIPTTDSTFDFGSLGFANYLVEIYTPAQAVDNSLNTYFEFGEQYDIGNAGLSNRYHKGGLTDQAADLSAPATFAFTQGDAYLKTRTSPVGAVGIYNVSTGTDEGDGTHTIGLDLKPQSAYNETYLTQSTPLLNYTGSGDSSWFVRTQGDTYTFRLTGKVTFTITQGQTMRMYVQYQPSSTIIELFPSTFFGTGTYTKDFDVSLSLPINTKAFLVMHHTAGTSVSYTTTEIKLVNSAIAAVRVIDTSFADTFLSEVNSNGRALVVDDNAKETYNPTLVRYSLAYQPGTNINQSNRFYAPNFDEYDRARGDIERLRVRGQQLRVFQRRGCGMVGIFEAILASADGSSNLLSTDKIINNIHYYSEEYGLGNQPTSLASSSSADYFTDPIRGYHVRLGADGLTPISELYKAQYWLPPIAKKYLANNSRSTGGYAKIMGTYNFMEEDFVTVFQSSTSLTGYTLAFNEPRNGYSSFFDYNPEWIMCAESTMISWNNGAIYIHDSATRNTFYGTAYPSKLSVVINPNANVKKEFLSLGYHSQNIWISPNTGDVSTTGGQRSNLVAQDFELKENMYHAAFWRDIDSIGGLVNGEYLLGTWLQLNLELTSSSLVFLYGLYVNYRISQKNF